MPGVLVEFPSYVNNLYCGLYDECTSCWRMEEVERRKEMVYLVDRVSLVFKEVGTEPGLPLVENKEERLVLRGDGGCRGRRGVCNKVKRLSVIMYKDLDFCAQCEARIDTACSLLCALARVGSSR